MNLMKAAVQDRYRPPETLRLAVIAYVESGHARGKVVVTPSPSH